MGGMDAWGADPWGADPWGGKGGMKGIDPWMIMAMKAKGKGKGADAWGMGPYGMMGGGGAWGAAKGGGIPAYGGGGGKKAAAESWDEGPTGEPPTTHWMEFGPDSSFVAAGMPSSGPALLYDKAKSHFQSAHHILAECITEIASDVTITHDEEWQQFPEAGPMFKELTGEENCCAIAYSTEHGKFGIGFHAGKKGRESGAKLALALAIATANPEVDKRCRSYFPEYKELVDGPGPKKQKGKKQKNQEAWGQTAAAAPAAGAGGAVPAIVFITLEDGSALVQQGLPAYGPAILYEKALNKSFSEAAGVLEQLAPGAEVEVQHDPDWNLFPEVAAAMTAAGIPEDCYCIAVCSSLGKWGVGVGSGWKTRETASKLSLAAALAGDLPESMAELAGAFPSFGKVLANAGIMT